MRLQIEKLLLPKTADELWSNFVELIAEMGYPAVFYSLRRFADMSRLSLSEDMEWRSTYSDALQDELRGNALLYAAPWGIWARDNSGVRDGSWAESADAAPYMSADGQRLVAMMRRHGVLAGHFLSLMGLSRQVSGTISFSTGPGTGQEQADKLWAEIGPEVTTIAKVFHLRSASLPQVNARRLLTRRQREVIEWVAYGKTVAEIAQILGVGSTTVEKHLRLAREALSAGTTAQAVLKARERNLIFIDDGGEPNKRR